MTDDKQLLETCLIAHHLFFLFGLSLKLFGPSTTDFLSLSLFFGEESDQHNCICQQPVCSHTPQSSKRLFAPFKDSQSFG
jgi:hypothetical protein